jgi:predicted nucleic acid-binding protein
LSEGCCFIAYFQEEEGRVDSCEAVLELAEQGKVLFVTSALTLSEVLALVAKNDCPQTANKVTIQSPIFLIEEATFIGNPKSVQFPSVPGPR